MLEKVHEFSLPTAVLDVVVGRGEQLYAACMDGVYRVDIPSAEVTRLGEHASYVSGVGILSERDELISAGYDGALQWYALPSGDRIRRVEAHQFWSWQMAVSPDRRWLASVSGQYLAGGEKYEPAEEREPSVLVLAAESGEVAHAWSHLPPVQSVAFSPDSRFLAAANLMGDIRVWDLERGELRAEWNTPAFTSWGIIKSHCYIGGIYALQFSPDGEHLLAAGMGPMRDPMAGNGKQLWQRFAWREDPPRQVDQTHPDDQGEGLMETLAFSPDGGSFVMGGRLRGGAWNVARFDSETGRLTESLKTGYRVTRARFWDPLSDHHPGARSDEASEDASDEASKEGELRGGIGTGGGLVIAGTKSQPSAPDGNSPPFGRVEIYQ